ncbi:MAG: metallophosphoesterase family protein [Minwuia sp.]|uniref:metallophosphoesterase family protein n=1 Tax=Minwuia sp. TaxID=2493630 RepID=UPI003A85DBBB
MTARTLRLGLIADIHHGPDTGTKIGSAAVPLMKDVLPELKALNADAVIELGDRINDVDHDTDILLQREVGDAFGLAKLEAAHLLGNHDNHVISREEAEEAFQKSFASYSFDRDGFHIVIWNAHTHLASSEGFRFAEGDLDWLRDDLAATELPTVICTHAPLDNGSLVGNFYFENHRQFGCYEAEGALAREVIERSGKVALCLAGHTHWNALNVVDGIPYVTVHSLTESFTTGGKPTGAWGVAEIGETVDIQVFGRDPARFVLPRRETGSHWTHRTKDYAPKPPALSAEARAARDRLLKK